MEKARPSEGEARGPSHYLEEIHVAALANALKRPIIVLAEQFQGGLFLPLRHDPEECRYPVQVAVAAAAADGMQEQEQEQEWRANPPLFLYLQFDHYLPLCPQDGGAFWEWAEGPEGFNGDEKALAALRKYEEARGGTQHRVPEWVEEIVLYVVTEVSECSIY